MVQKNPNFVDENLIAVLKYNYACCFNRFGMVDESIKALQEAIVVLRRKLDAINERTNNSFVERSQTFSTDSAPATENLAEQSVLSN